MMGCRQIQRLKQFTGFILSVKRCFDGMKNQIQFPPIRKNVTILLCFMKVHLYVTSVGVVTCQHDIWKKLLRHNNSEEYFSSTGWSGAPSIHFADEEDSIDNFIFLGCNLAPTPCQQASSSFSCRSVWADECSPEMVYPGCCHCPAGLGQGMMWHFLSPWQTSFGNCSGAQV